jgi:hypothetical protein
VGLFLVQLIFQQQQNLSDNWLSVLLRKLAFLKGSKNFQVTTVRG